MNVSFSGFPAAERFFRLLGLLLSVWWLLRPGPAQAQTPGLPARPVTGAFLGGAFPAQTPGSGGTWSVVDAFPGLTFQSPIRMLPEPRSNRLWVIGREGHVYWFTNTPGVSQRTLALNLTAQTQGLEDCGLLGIAFHPQFNQAGSPNRNFIYLYYNFSPSPALSGTVNPDWDSYNRLSRFTINETTRLIDRASEQVLVNQFDTHTWHNGGDLFFGTDGFLYFCNGDEGSANDPWNHGQRLNGGLFAGVFRIDVDRDPARSHPIRRQPATTGARPPGWPATYTQNYFIPNDNPYQDPNGGVLEEFYALGLRNPHRMTRDPVSGRFFIGDIGQGTEEEVSVVTRPGQNFQWPYREGSVGGPKAMPSPLTGFDTPPLFSYGRGAGDTCVIGGFVYRGREHAAELGGRYLFGDNTSGRIWSLTWDGVAVPQRQLLATVAPGTKWAGLSGFGNDADDELYIMTLGMQGRVMKLARTGQTPQPPARLSQTGAFTSLATLTPAPALVPYATASPLWSDGAEKWRWAAVPTDGPPFSSAEQVTFSPDGAWQFPVGSVLVKHFELPLSDTDPAQRTRLETRFMVRTATGWYGVTYRWRPDNSDADLLMDGAVRDITVATAGGGSRTQTWTFPSRVDCMICHNPNSGQALGLRTWQLNSLLAYPGTGRTDNQLATWSAIGMFDRTLAPDEIAAFPRAVRVDDPTASLDSRVRSYLDANCAHCHQPGGVRAGFDARFSTPLHQQQLVNGPVADALGIAGAALVRPQSVAQSIVHARMAAIEAHRRMPPLGRSIPDARALAALTEWIGALRTEAMVPGTAVAGVSAEYFSGIAFNSRVLTRTEPVIDFAWGNAGSPGTTVPAEQFSARWTGEIVIPTTGSWTFATVTDDGARLWLDGQLVVDKWIDQAPTEWPAPALTFTAGQRVRFVMEYYERFGNAVAQLLWSGPGTPKQVVPASALVRLVPNAPVARPDAATVPAGGTVAIPVLANDSDPDGPLSAAGLAVTGPPARGSLSLDTANARLVYTQNGPLGPSDSFRYRLADVTGLTSEEVTVSLTIQSLNRAPLVTRPADQSTQRGATSALQIAATDPDNDALVFSAAGLPAGLTINAGTGRISGTVATAAAAANAVTITVSDGRLSASTSFAWATTAPPPPPPPPPVNGLLAEFFAGTIPGVGEPLLRRIDAVVAYEWGASSPEPAVVPPDFFSARWSGDLVARHSETHTFVIPADNGVRLWIGNQLVLDKWTPGITGTWLVDVPLVANVRTPIRLEYFEEGGGANLSLIWYSPSQPWEAVPASRLIPAGAGDTTPPSASLGTLASTVSGAFTVNAVFSEPVTGLTAADFTLTNATAGTLAGSGADYQLTVIPTAPGQVTVALPAGAASDAAANPSTAASPLAVTFTPPPNRPPVLTSPGNQSSIRGSIVSLAVNASDPDNQTLAFTATGLPAGLAIDAATGRITGTVSLLALATQQVTLTVRDPAGATASASFTWTTAAAPANGLLAQFFTGTTPGLANPVLTRTDPAIRFEWGLNSPGPGVPPDNFSARWTGELLPAFSETYTFLVFGDNGVRLWIDNVLVIDRWASGSTGTYTGTIALTAGRRVPIRLDYFEENGGANVSLVWVSNSQPWDFIAADRLFPASTGLGSGAAALGLVNDSLRLESDARGRLAAVFLRDPALNGVLATFLETSRDLAFWDVVDAPAAIDLLGDGRERVRIALPPLPGAPLPSQEGSSPPPPALPARFYRVRLQTLPAPEDP